MITSQAVRDHLCEMNPDCNGYSRVANFQNVLQTGKLFPSLSLSFSHLLFSFILFVVSLLSLLLQNLIISNSLT
jgi:hypothetical protein